MRVPLIVLALVATPLAVGVSQGRGQIESTKCNPDQEAAVARARAAGRPVPPGLAKKDCAQPLPPPPPPAPEPPPTGVNKSVGVVFEDLDGNGSRDAFAGEMGLIGWSVQLYYRPTGQLAQTTSTDDAGGYVFHGLGNGDWFVCVVPQSGYSQTFPGQDSNNPCGGWGSYFTLSGSFETWAMNDFGQKLN